MAKNIKAIEVGDVFLLNEGLFLEKMMEKGSFTYFEKGTKVRVENEELRACLISINNKDETFDIGLRVSIGDDNINTFVVPIRFLERKLEKK